MLNYNAGTKSTFVCLEKKMIRFWCTHSLVLVNCLNECWLRSLDILRQHSFRQFTNTNESIGSASTLFPEHFDTKYQMTLAYVRLNIMHILIWFFPTNWICQMHLTYYKFVSSTFNLCWKKIRLYACYIQSNLCKCHWQKILLCQSVVWTQTVLPSVLAAWRLLISTTCRPGGFFLSLGGLIV